MLTAGVAFSSSFVKLCHGPPELLVPLPAVGSVQLADVEPSVSLSEQGISPDLTGVCKSSIAQVEAVPSLADSNRFLCVGIRGESNLFSYSCHFRDFHPSLLCKGESVTDTRGVGYRCVKQLHTARQTSLSAWFELEEVWD